MLDEQKRETSLQIDTVILKSSALVIRAVNHKLRKVIMQLLYNKGKLTVTEIYTTLHLEQSVASQHLGILRKGGFVKTTREGKYIYYEVNEPRLEEVHEIAGRLVKVPHRRHH